MFVVFEGIDRCGKSTQSKRLVKHFQEKLSNFKGTAHLLRYPERSDPATGSAISKYLSRELELDGTAASLLFTANIWQTARDRIRPVTDNPSSHDVIVMDRYTWSNIAYSVARGVPRDLMVLANKSLPIPDITLLMKLDPKDASRRGEYGGERFDNIEFQTAVATQMDQFAKESNSPVFLIDASQSEDVVAASINAIVDPILEKMLNSAHNQIQ